MKRIISSSPVITFILALTVLLSGCEKKGEERYKDPPWLGGTIFETLETDSTGATFDIYFQLLKKADYTESIEKGLYTVFVASDDAYEKFFQENGIGSVYDISEETATNYVTLNILESPRARHQLVYGYHFGVWQGPGSELGALTFRTRTRSRSNNIIETVRYFEPLKGMEVKLDDERKYMSLFSTEFYRDYAGATDGTDYTYFFPETEWTGLQWYNANIIRKEVRASNGFIYYLDKAIPYVPSIEEFLIANGDKYDVWYDAYQRFAGYRSAGFDEDFNRIYDKYYTGVTDITSERGPTDDGTYSRRDIWSVFVPINEAMQKYLDENILAYYPSLDSVPEVTLIYLLQSHIFPNFLLPSKMTLPIFDAFGDEVTIDPFDGIVEKSVLSNSAVFGIDYVMEPLAFKAVTRPLFFNGDYTTFLYMMFESGLIPSISKADIRATILAPNNENLEAAGFRYDPIREEIQEQYPDGDWYPMKRNDVTDFVKGQIIYQDERDYSGEGFQELESGDWIYYKNNQIIAGGNSEDGDLVNVVEPEVSELNGILYHLDNVVKPPLRDAAILISEDPALSEFYALLDSAGMIKLTLDPILQVEIPELTFLAGAEQVTAFVPDNNAILAAQTAGIIPADKAELQEFLQYHFLTEQAVFDDGVFSGAARTSRYEGIIAEIPTYSELIIENAAGDLKVKDNSGQVISVDHNSANELIHHGVVQKISQVLLYN